MIPSLSSLLLPGHTGLPVPAALPEMTSVPLPLVPTFTLGTVSPLPQPDSLVIDERAQPEESDPEQLMQLLLEPARTPATAAPQVHTQLQATPNFDLPSARTTPQSDESQVQTAPQTQVAVPVATLQLPVAPQYDVPQFEELSQKQIAAPVTTPQLPVAPQCDVPQVQSLPQMQVSTPSLASPWQSSPLASEPHMQISVPVITPLLADVPQRDVPQVQTPPQMQVPAPLLAPSWQSLPQENAPHMPAAVPQIQVSSPPLVVSPFNAPQIQPGSPPTMPMTDGSTAMLQTMQFQKSADPIITPVEMASTQPLKLRTPKDAHEASIKAVALMQAQPQEPLAKVLPPQMSVHTQQLLNLTHPASPSAAPALTQSALTLPEAAQEKAAVLRQALGEHLKMQIDQRSQKATIRLDPPNLGKLDISLHFEGGKLQVQIQAAQPDVYRALQQVSQELRGALVEHNHVAVNVQILQQQGDQRHAPHQQHTQEAVLSNNALNEVTEEQRHRDLSILTTV